MNEFKNCFVASFCVKIFLLSWLQSHISPLWPETGVQQKKVWVRPDPDPKKGQGTTRSESKKGLGKTESGFKKKALVRLDPDTKKKKKWIQPDPQHWAQYSYIYWNVHYSVRIRVRTNI